MCDLISNLQERKQFQFFKSESPDARSARTQDTRLTRSSTVHIIQICSGRFQSSSKPNYLSCCAVPLNKSMLLGNKPSWPRSGAHTGEKTQKNISDDIFSAKLVLTFPFLKEYVASHSTEHFLSFLFSGRAILWKAAPSTTSDRA